MGVVNVTGVLRLREPTGSVVLSPLHVSGILPATVTSSQSWVPWGDGQVASGHSSWGAVMGWELKCLGTHTPLDLLPGAQGNHFCRKLPRTLMG